MTLRHAFLVRRSLRIPTCDPGQEILAECCLERVRCTPTPIASSSRIIACFWPRIDDRLPPEIGLKSDDRLGKSLSYKACEVFGAWREACNVVYRALEIFLRRAHQTHRCVDRFRHCHEWDARIRSNKAVILPPCCCCVNHLRAVIACSPEGIVSAEIIPGNRIERKSTGFSNRSFASLR